MFRCSCLARHLMPLMLAEFPRRHGALAVPPSVQLFHHVYSTTSSNGRSFRANFLARRRTRTPATPNPDWSIPTTNPAFRSDLHVVLVSPQIPQNAGNVCRTCAATNVSLHLVEPLGFKIDDRALKRAGLDYWQSVCVRIHPSWTDFYNFFSELNQPKRLIAFSKFSNTGYAEPSFRYEPGDFLLFGSETTGLPRSVHDAARAHGAIVRIPITERHVRSLNLATSTAVGLYEAIRQLDTRAGRPMLGITFDKEGEKIDYSTYESDADAQLYYPDSDPGKG